MEKFKAYKRSETETVYGTVISGSADLGDYGVSPLVDFARQNGEIIYSCPESKIIEV